MSLKYQRYLPELFIQAGLHAPRIRFGRYDNAFDGTREFFAAPAGFDAGRIDQLMALNEATIEAAGVDQASHTVLASMPYCTHAGTLGASGDVAESG